jgi:transposase
MSASDPIAVQATLTAEQLPDDVATLKAMLLETLSSLQEQRHNLDALQQRIQLLLRRLYGPRGERFDPRQLLLFSETTDQEPTPAEPSEATTPSKPRRTCRPHGRRRLPDNLPRVTQHHVLTEAERLCARCGQVRHEIGLDRSEQLDYKPASLFVVEHVLHKYACRCCSQQGQQRAQDVPPPPAAPPEQTATHQPLPAPAPQTEVPDLMNPSHEPSSEGNLPTDQASPTPTAAPAVPPTAEVVIAASKPAMPIAKGLPGPGLLAHLIVSKYTDHLPLHRLEHIYERQGLFLPRSTLCDWLLACAQLLRPLYERLVLAALQSAALHTDDTPVKLRDPKTHVLSTARLWAYLGDASHPCNVFDFTLNRQRDGPRDFLANYRGYLHADAFSGYDCLYLPDPHTTQARIIEVACNAHARRKFYEAQGTDAVRAYQALAYYRQLYELERQAKDFSESQRLQMRRDLSVPILDKFHAWIEKEQSEVLPKSPMAEAFGYALNNWSALVRYTEAGFLAIDNNVAEREMKRIAIGRKNWLFVGSPRGGRAAAVLLSFTSTCHRLGVEPWSYLHDVLSRLPTLPAEQLDTLLPDRWQQVQRGQQGSAPIPSDGTISSGQSDS